jgi:hypothetical protein
MALGQQGDDDLAAGVVGVSHEQKFTVQALDYREHQGDHLVEQSSLVQSAQDQALVDPRCQWHGGDGSGWSLDE